MYRVLAALICIVLGVGTLPASAQTKIGPERIVGSGADNPAQPGLTPLGAGLLFSDEEDLSIYSAAGVKSPVTFSTPYGQYAGSMRELPDGTFIVVEVIYPNLFIQRYSASGPKIGSPIQVNPTVTQPPNTLIYYEKVVTTRLSGGSFVIAWVIETYNEITRTGTHTYVAQRFDRNLNPVGSMMQISNPVLPDSTVVAPVAPAMAALGNGDFVICWQLSDTVMRGQRFTAAGNPVGAKFTIADAAEAVVASQPGGGFVVVWQSPTRQKLFGWRYQGTAPVGAKFPIVPLAGHMQVHPSIARLPNGGIVVAWGEYGGSIYVATYSPSGKALHAAPIRVNQNHINGQDYPVVGVLTNGGFMVAWEGIVSEEVLALAQTFGP
ncbi:MAG: hypothetical protein WBD48_14845 [Pseudolabrys sp.]